MRQAITTRTLGPTNTKGSRIIAEGPAGRVIVAWDHALTIEDNHRAAALAFARTRGWAGRWIGGGTKDGYAFVDMTDTLVDTTP